ncbi:MAG: hypothetical protein KAJ03_01405 [Gammaproteobacteria bacterium]|nr:hypothetical protein [Gammaproteobacteria bacterium]
MGDNGFFGATVTPVIKRFYGDKEAAERLIGIGRKYHGQMVDNNIHNLPNIQSKLTTPSGVIYKLSRVGGLDIVEIYVPPGEEVIDIPETIIILGYIVKAGINYEYTLDKTLPLFPEINIEMLSGTQIGFNDTLPNRSVVMSKGYPHLEADVLAVDRELPFTGFPDNGLKYLPYKDNFGAGNVMESQQVYMQHFHEDWQYSPDTISAVDPDTGDPKPFEPPVLFNESFDSYQTIWDGLEPDRNIHVTSPYKRTDNKGFMIQSGSRLGGNGVVFTRPEIVDGRFTAVMLPSGEEIKYSYDEAIPVNNLDQSDSNSRLFEVDEEFTVGGETYKFTEEATMVGVYTRTISGSRDFALPGIVEGGLHSISFKALGYFNTHSVVVVEGEKPETMDIELVLLTDQGFISRFYTVAKDHDVDESFEPLRVWDFKSTIYTGLSVMIGVPVDIDDFDTLINTIPAPVVNDDGAC